MVDTKPTEACKHSEAGTQEDTPVISPTLGAKMDQVHSGVPRDPALLEGLSTHSGMVQDTVLGGSSDGHARRERFTSERQQASQEITILVTNHEAQGIEIAEAEKIEIPLNLDLIPSAECTTPTEDDSLDGSKVVADLIKLSELQETSMISNSASLVEHDLPKSDQSKEVHIEQTKIPADSKPLDRTDSVELSQWKQDQLPEQPQQVTQTQVSLDAIYQSVATSPMTPPQGSAAFFFPYSLTKLGTSGGSEAVPSVQMKDAELQVGAQVEYRSVATAPMTPVTKNAPDLQLETRSVATAPMTPVATTAPDLYVETRSVATAPMTPIATTAPELPIETRSVATAPMTPLATTAPELQVETRSIATAPMTPLATTAPELHVDTRSIATAPMTPIATTAPELQVETRSIATAPMTPIATTAPELQVETRSVATAPMTPIATRPPQLQVETRSIATAPMTPIATRPPQLHIETRSIATAPMTPIATRPPQLHIETRSIATAPMTPIATRPPQLHIETRSIATAPMTPIVRKAHELQVHSIATSPMSPIVLSSPELIPQPEPRAEPRPDELPEPVQEVSWDEKGMTWEVYGAVVEVTVLGTAIQKHLEKQVKKQRKLSAGTPASNVTDTPTPFPSSPPATSASSRCSSSRGSRKKEEPRGQRVRRRQNPLRFFARNVRRPSCCSRAHSEERH